MEFNKPLDDLNFDTKTAYSKKSIELISLNKFILFYFLSFGLYGIWWMFKSWKFFQEKDHLDIMPAARAIFAIIFTLPLFEKILHYAKLNGYNGSYSSTGLFVAFILLNLCSKLPDPYWLVSFLAFIPLIEPFRVLNYAISKSESYIVEERNGLNTRQIVLVIIGVIFWALMILGLTLPQEY